MNTCPDLSRHLKEAMDNLPYISADLPGVGGEIKADPEHFQVEEILPYMPCGQGEHVFIRLRRKQWNTADVGRSLGQAFQVKGADIGWAGRKDKCAVTTQTFSLRLPMSLSLTQVEATLEDLPFDILEVKRHGNKLKTGHVKGNRFRIILTQTGDAALASAEQIGQKISRTGIPNFYGEQRFGIDLRNIDRAMALVKRGKARGKKDGFMVSVLQSALFNVWLQERLERGDFNTVLPGDVVKKTDTGGMFLVEDLQDALTRFEKRLIVYTGPIYGHKMRTAGALEAEHEARLLQLADLKPASFKPLRAPGSRRIAILHLDDLQISAVDAGLQLCFTLPSGAYATTVMREFTR